MTDNNPKKTIEEILGHWRPRFWVSGVDPNDLALILSRISVWEDWYREWYLMGEEHEKLGDEAKAAGRNVTAGDAYFRASMYYHFSQFMWHHKPDEKEAAARKRVATYVKGAPCFSPPCQPVEIPFENKALPGYFRLAADEPGPCVLLLPGSDSCKEQLFPYENEFLRRGVSTLSIDGPGQGIFRYEMPMRHDYEKAVTAAVDWLLKGQKVDGSRIAVSGNSLGGYLAIRSVAFEQRLKAAVCIGGRYDLSEWRQRSDLMKNNMTFLFGKSSWDEAEEFARGITLKGILGRVNCPVLIVHGAKDRISPVANAYRIAEELRQAELVVFEHGNHSCNNMPYRCRPLVADWVKERLG